MNIIILPMLDGNACVIISKLIIRNLGIVAVSTPNSIIAFKNAVLQNFIATEGRLNPICWRVRKIVAKNNVIITATYACIHRSLAGPQEKSVATVRCRVLEE